MSEADEEVKVKWKGAKAASGEAGDRADCPYLILL